MSIGHDDMKIPEIWIHEKNYGQSQDWIEDYPTRSLSPISTIG